MQLIDVVSAPWAIAPDRLEEIQGIYARHLRGEKIDLAGIEAKIGQPLANVRRDLVIEDGVAIISIDGVLAKRANLFMQISGGTSMQIAEQQVRAAIADDSVRTIVLHVDSPGGTVDGTEALAEAVFSARGIKPVYAVIDGMGASAAYWVASGAERVFISSLTTMVGSIGVVAKHVDRSRADKNAGFDTTEITAGKYKRIASDNGPLTGEGRASIQEMVNAYYEIFVDTVAKHRGVSPETVLTNMADGRTFIGRKAIDAGLVDGVATLDQVVSRAAAGGYQAASLTALDGSSEPVAHGDVPTMDIAKLKKEHPEVASALIAEGHAAGRVEGVTAGKAEGRTEGATQERARIAAVLEQSMPGHEALVNSLAFDGKTTGPEAAVQVLQAERKLGSQRLADIAADGQEARASHAAVLEPVAVAQVESIKAPPGYSVDAKGADLHQKTLGHMAAHPGVDYVTAYKAVGGK